MSNLWQKEIAALKNIYGQIGPKHFKYFSARDIVGQRQKRLDLKIVEVGEK